MTESCATVRCSHPARVTVMSQEGRWEWLDRFCSRCAVRFVSEGVARWLTMEERLGSSDQSRPMRSKAPTSQRGQAA